MVSTAAAEAEALAGVADLQAEEVSGFAPAAAPAASGSSFFKGFPFSQGQEVINARAAMAGFVAAVISEAWTQKSVWTQIAGRCETPLTCCACLSVECLCSSISVLSSWVVLLDIAGA